MENLIIENYHDTKKLIVRQKISFTRAISLHVRKMSQPPPPPPPYFFNLFRNATVSWNENEEDTVLNLNQEKYNSKTKMK